MEQNEYKKYLIWLTILSLPIESAIFSLAGKDLKIWMFCSAIMLYLLVTDLIKSGLSTSRKNTRLSWFGAAFLVFSFISTINSPLPSFALKQLLILALLLVIGVFFEINSKKFLKTIYSSLFVSLFSISLLAILQNIAFNYGLYNREVMAARPNVFFPEPDWLGLFLALNLGVFLPWIWKKDKQTFPEWLQKKYLLEINTTLGTIALLLTVARASWLALLGEIGVIIAATFLVRIKTRKNLFKESILPSIKQGLGFLVLILVSFSIVQIFKLSRFDIVDRFRSIFFGEHVITMAYSPTTGEKFKINLEEKDYYRNKGYQIKEDYVKDENVESRGERAQSGIEIAMQHPIIGSGLGITQIKTDFKHNANNLFIEWWASAGILGLGTFLILLIYLLYQGWNSTTFNKTETIQIIFAGITGFTLVNLFNSAIFLAFAWFYLGFLFSLIKKSPGTSNQ